MGPHERACLLWHDAPAAAAPERQLRWQVLHAQPSQAAADFALRLVRSLVLVEQTAQPGDLSATLSALMDVSAQQQDAPQSETLQRLVTLVHQPAQQARHAAPAWRPLKVMHLQLAPVCR